MKLLITTQAVDKNHSNLGLFHTWLEEFAKHCEAVSVICLYEGEHSLPQNVRVYSLGKERGAVSSVRYAWRFWRLIFKVRDYDAVFVHMNPEYIVLGGFFWRAWGKRITLWYTHKSVDLKLRIAVWFTNAVCTASKESFRLASRKVRVVGHGIDTTLFTWNGSKKSELRICTFGRIAPVKRLVEMLGALDSLAVRNVQFSFGIAGEPVVAQDKAYQKHLWEEIRRRPYASAVRMAGVVPYKDLPAWLADKSVFLNLSLTGSVDRAVLEAAACGVVPVSSNEAFKEWLSPYGLYVDAAPASVADGIIKAGQIDPAPLVEYVRREHSLSSLIPKILATLGA